MEKRMWFSRTLLLLLLYAGVALSGDDAVDDVLKSSKEIINSTKESEAADIESFQSPAADSGNSDWMKGQSLDEQPDGPSSTAQQRAWNQIAGGLEEGVEVRDEGPPRPPIPSDVMYVYMSLSMPEETIRSLFNQALAEPNIRSIIFVLRGWQPPGPNSLVARLNKLFPEAKKLRDLPNVQINPTLFAQQGISVVPTFTSKDKDGRWGSVVGSTSIRDAVSRIENARYDAQVIGPTFEIEEPDILQLIRERTAAVDWESHVERVKSDMLTKNTTGRALPYSEEDESYLVDLTIVNNKDLQGTSGEVFAPAGVSINPLDYLTTKKRWIFFDANNEAQLAQAMQWRAEFEYTTFITTIAIRNQERRKEVIGQLGQPVHEINELLIKRFRLKAVPSIAYQEGRMLRVDTVAMPLNATANLESTSND